MDHTLTAGARRWLALTAVLAWLGLAVSLTLIPMLSSLKARAPLQFPDEVRRDEAWAPRQAPLRGLAAIWRGLQRGIGALIYVLGTLFARVWHLVSAVVACLGFAWFQKTRKGFAYVL